MPGRETVERLCDHLVRSYRVDRRQISVIFAPYRICPLGAHIDHQLGNVTAMALDRGVLLAFAPAATPEVTLRSMDFAGEVRFGFDAVPAPIDGDWGNYARGAVRALQPNHSLKTGLVGITQGKVAEGGLSSSAAVGVAYLLALESVNDLQVTVRQNIAMEQMIENDYLGLSIGILDQSAILCSRKGHLTWIDCAEVDYQLIPRSRTMPSFSILIAFSGLRKSLVGTDYNRRVAECAEAARVLLEAADRSASSPLLGNVTVDQYASYRDRLSGPPARRAVHFFSEMQRVRDGIDAWRNGNLGRFGELISESGASSIHNYECGAPALVDLYHSLVEADGVHGARFSGAGFRGCCLALVEPDKADLIASTVLDGYRREHPELAGAAWSMQCASGDGARFLVRSA